MTQTPEDKKLQDHMKSTPILELDTYLRESVRRSGYLCEGPPPELVRIVSFSHMDFGVFGYNQITGDDSAWYLDAILLSSRRGRLYDVIAEGMRRFGGPAEPAQCRPSTRQLIGTTIYYPVFDHFRRPFTEKLLRSDRRNRR